jgi:hypothetical protein
MEKTDRRREMRLRLNRLLILLMVAGLLGGLLLSQWQQVLINAVLL